MENKWIPDVKQQKQIEMMYSNINTEYQQLYW